MSEAHDQLRRLMAGTPGIAPDVPGKRFQWPHVLSLVQEVRAVQSPESEEVLRALAQYERELILDESAGLPHSMSPEDMLRSLAVQALGNWNPARHQDAIRRAGELADSDRVLEQVRKLL